MGNPRIRGLVYLAVFIVAAAIFCGWVPFVLLPNLGAAVALPVIEVPGEVVIYDFLPGFNLTNTLIATVITDILIIVFVFLVWNASKGWTKKVPGRLQAWTEIFAETLYNFLRNIGGEHLRRAPLLWPLVATIFLFLFTANLMKLFPGVETVGNMHCAYVGQSGYPAIEGWTGGSARLWVDEPLNAGTTQTEATEEACNEFFYGGWEPFEAEDAATIAARRDEFAAEIEPAAEGEDEGDHTPSEAEIYVQYADERIESAERIGELEERIAAIDAEIEDLEGAEAAAEEVVEEVEEENEGVPPVEEEEVVVDVASIEAELEDLRNERETLVEELNLEQSQLEYPGATLALTPEQLDQGALPYIFHITPWVRGAATDLSLTFALALLSVFAAQLYGIWALGPAYFEKFINLSAVGKAGKRPLGIVDFIVGLFEIISEIGKIVSLAFRLFGNLFAGSVALIAVTFLLALFVPAIIYGLEIIIGVVQALVFAVLTVVYAVQAIEAHHGDHDDEHHDEHEGAYYDTDAYGRDEDQADQTSAEEESDMTESENPEPVPSTGR